MALLAFEQKIRERIGDRGGQQFQRVAVIVAQTMFQSGVAFSVSMTRTGGHFARELRNARIDGRKLKQIFATRARYSGSGVACDFGGFVFEKAVNARRTARRYGCGVLTVKDPLRLTRNARARLIAMVCGVPAMNSVSDAISSRCTV